MQIPYGGHPVAPLKALAKIHRADAAKGSQPVVGNVGTGIVLANIVDGGLQKALLALGESGLFELKTGFRAKYIYDAVSKIDSGELDVLSLTELEDTDECIRRLCAVKGIGVKVASCAALFGMKRYDAFPIDVWMKRVAEKYFAEDEVEFSSKRFGRYAGVAQQYLFYYERYCGGDR